MLAIPFYFLALLHAIWIAIGNDPLLHISLTFLYIGIALILDVWENKK